MGDFSDSSKWKLVNDFTIHEDRNLSDGRPFMRTCVPKTLYVVVNSLQIVRSVEWPSDFGKPKPDAYIDRSCIRFSGEFHDKVIVFSMSDGEVATFRSLIDAVIRPLPPGQIGGKRKATAYDAIAFSGMTSRDVPDGGLMDGEPGALTYLSEFEEPGGSKSQASLTAELFLDEDKFSQLLTAASTNSHPLRSVRLQILAELFESEVSASLSEPWMSHDYGLLLKGSSIARTNARIEWMTVSFDAPLTIDVDKPRRDDGANEHEALIDVSPSRPIDQRADHNRILVKYQRYTLIALLILIIVTVITA